MFLPGQTTTYKDSYKPYIISYLYLVIVNVKSGKAWSLRFTETIKLVSDKFIESLCVPNQA